MNILEPLPLTPAEKEAHIIRSRFDGDAVLAFMDATGLDKQNAVSALHSVGLSQDGMMPERFLLDVSHRTSDTASSVVGLSDAVARYQAR